MTSHFPSLVPNPTPDGSVIMLAQWPVYFEALAYHSSDQSQAPMLPSETCTLVLKHNSEPKRYRIRIVTASQVLGK